MPYYQTAADAAKVSIQEIDQLMVMINVELTKYRVQHSFDYGHAGSLKEIERKLGEVWEFVAETD